jgi:NAD(P)-dependent dehydrogenase (short-subunit alcohol dehydrogenase family)
VLTLSFPTGKTQLKTTLTAVRAALDVDDDGSVTDAVDKVLAENGCIDVLVNNAGVSSGGGSCCPFLASLKHSYRLNEKMQMTLPGNLCDVFVRN